MAIQTLPNGTIFVPHGDWSRRVRGSRGNRGGPLKQAGWRDEVNIHHSVTIAQGDPEMYGVLDPSDDPCKDARVIEDILAVRGLLPGYNYLIHPSGVILELAGPFIGAHTAGRNSASKSLCFIGNFERQQPTEAALIAAGRSIRLLQLGGDLLPDIHAIKILGHRHHKPTACPGHNLNARLDKIREYAVNNV